MNLGEHAYPNDGFSILRFTKNGREVYESDMVNQAESVERPDDDDDEYGASMKPVRVPTYEQRDGYSATFWRDAPCEIDPDDDCDDDEIEDDENREYAWEDE